MKIVNMIIILITKIISFILRLCGKSAGTLPGRIALKLNKNIRDFIKLKGKLIVVTGTNGKTTTTNMIYEILRKSNKSVICNTGGNNIAWGITTLLLTNANISGELDYDYVVIETDEHFVPVIYQKQNLSIDSLIVLNLFADQLDRTGDTEYLISKLEKFISNSFSGNLILNGNDPNVVRLGLSNEKGKNHYYAVDKLENSFVDNQNVICPQCKKSLNYKFKHYSTVGEFSCKNCDFGKITYDVLVTKKEGNKFYISDKVYKSSNPSLYNVYNLCSIIALGKIYDLNNDILNNVFENYKSTSGRYQQFKIKGNNYILNLGKNPTGFNVILNNIKEDTDKKELLLILNDKVNDGCDVSWIWDIDFSNMDSFDRIICCGTRAYDMAIKIKCNGYDINKIIVEHDVKSGIEKLMDKSNKKYIISNYSPLPQALKILQGLERNDK